MERRSWTTEGFCDEHPNIHHTRQRPHGADAARHRRRAFVFCAAGRDARFVRLPRRCLGHAGLWPQRTHRALQLQGPGPKLRDPHRKPAVRRAYAGGPQHGRHGGAGGDGAQARAGQPAGSVRHVAFVRQARWRLAARIYFTAHGAAGRRQEHDRAGPGAGAANDWARLAARRCAPCHCLHEPGPGVDLPPCAGGYRHFRPARQPHADSRAHPGDRRRA